MYACLKGSQERLAGRDGVGRQGHRTQTALESSVNCHTSIDRLLFSKVLEDEWVAEGPWAVGGGVSYNEVQQGKTISRREGNGPIKKSDGRARGRICSDRCYIGETSWAKHSVQGIPRSMYAIFGKKCPS